MNGQCIQDKIYQLMSLGASSLPETFPLFPYIKKTLSLMTRPFVNPCAPTTNCCLLEASEVGSLIALCVEILLNRDSPLSLLQIASDVLLLAFKTSPKEDVLRSIVSLAEAALNRWLKISTTRLVLSLFHAIIKNNIHEDLFTDTGANNILDGFSFEIVHLCVLAKLAMTDGHDIGITIYKEDVEASGIHTCIIIFFSAFLMNYLVPDSDISRTPFYSSLAKRFPTWIPKRFLDGFECLSVIELLRTTLCFLTQRLLDLKTFLFEHMRFVGDFIILVTSITCSSREIYKILRQVAVEIVVLLIEFIEEISDFESPICVTLFHCLNSLTVLPLFSKSVMFSNLACTTIQGAIGHLVLSDAYSCLNENTKAELKKQKENLAKEFSVGSSKPDRVGKMALERPLFCLWSLLRVITGERIRLYLLYLIKLSYLPSTSLFLHYLLDVLMTLAGASNQDVSSLAFNCITNLYAHSINVIAHALSITSDSTDDPAGVFKLQSLSSISAIQSRLFERLDFLGKVRGIGSSVLSCSKTIRDAKPSTIVSAISNCLANDFNFKESPDILTMLSLLSGIVHPSIPFLLLFSKKGSITLTPKLLSGDTTNTCEPDEYFYRILCNETIHSDMDELDLFRLCFSNFLLSGEGQEIERAMISISNALARIINELPNEHKVQLIGHAPSLRILLGSIVVLTTECLSEKISLSSKMTQSRFVSILMGSSQIKEYLSSNYQASELSHELPVPLHDDLVAKFSSIYQRVRNAPLAVDRTIYDTLSLSSGIALPPSICIKLADAMDNKTDSIVNLRQNTPSSFTNVFKDWCTSSSMLPGTIDQLIKATIHQSHLHMCTMDRLKTILSPYIDNAITPLEYYIHLYLLIHSTLIRFVSDALAGTIGSGSLALSADCSSGLYAACYTAHVYSLQVLGPLITPFTSSNNSKALLASIIERELISSSYLLRYFSDQCEYLRLSEYMSSTSPGTWISLGSKIHSGGVSHIYAALYAINICSFIRYSRCATERWRTKNLNDVLIHMARGLIGLHALNIISKLSLDLSVDLNIYPGFQDATLQNGPLVHLQSVCYVFSYCDDAMASKFLMCIFEVCKEIVTAYETKSDYSLIIHDGMINLLVRSATLEGLDAGESSLIKHTAQVSVIYMSIMILGSLKLCINIIPHITLQALTICIPEIINLINLATKVAQTHKSAIYTSLQPIYLKLRPGFKQFNYEITVTVLSLCVYLLTLKKVVEGVKTNIGCISDVSLIYKRLEEIVLMENGSIKFISESIASLMGDTCAELNSLNNNIVTLGAVTLSYSQLCLVILRRYTSKSIFLSTLLDSIRGLLGLPTYQSAMLHHIFITQLQSFTSSNLLVLASQLYQLFYGEPIDSDILKSRRSVTLILHGNSKVVILPPLASFFFGCIEPTKNCEKSDESANSMLLVLASVLLPKKIRDASQSVVQAPINKETVEKFAKFLKEISSGDISQNETVKFLSRLCTDSFDVVITSNNICYDVLSLYFALSMYHFMDTIPIYSQECYLSLPIYSLDDSNKTKDGDTAPSIKTTQFAIPLLLPIFLVTRALENTSGSPLLIYVIDTLIFFIHELGTSDDSKAFLFQQVLIPIILLAQNTVPLTQLEQNLSRSPEIVSKIINLSKEIITSITTIDLKENLSYQLSLLSS